MAIFFLAACQATADVHGSRIDAMPPAVGEFSYAGGDGMTQANAVIVIAPSERVGVAAEYDWIRARYPGALALGTSTSRQNGRSYDSIDIETKDGTHRTFYFDISNFFGKF
jgi:hypothetical protein